MVNINIILPTLMTLTISILITSTAYAIDDNQTSMEETSSTGFGTALTGIEEQRPFAKFSVKTQLSNECISSPSICSNIKEDDIYEQVYVFYPNSYDLVTSFPGSNLPRILVFDSERYFEYPNTFSTEVTVDKPEIYNNVTLELDSCSVYLSPGQEKNCVITIKPQ